MIFSGKWQDNMQLRRPGEGQPRPFLRVLVVVIAVILVVLGINYTWKKHVKTKTTRPAAEQGPAVNAQEQQILNQISAKMAERDSEEARSLCYQALEQSEDSTIKAEIERILGQLNIRAIQRPEMTPDKIEYVVAAGDSLERIAKKFGTTVELIRQSNALQRDTIHPGDRLRIFNANLSIEVSKSRNDLVLKANDVFLKRYRVGTGQYGKTPVGTFMIADKIKDPPWWRPDGQVVPFGDKENVLGTRWMSITAMEDTPKVSGYGIHGTWEPNTIGTQASAGCVRLFNEDVEELFLLVPVGTRVTITE